MKTAEPAPAAEVDARPEQAHEADAAEAQDATRRWDETPDLKAGKRRPLKTIRAAEAALEAGAVYPPAPENGSGSSSGMRWQGGAAR